MSKFPRQIDVTISTWIRLSKPMKSRRTSHVEFQRQIDWESTKMCPLGCRPPYLGDKIFLNFRCLEWLKQSHFDVSGSLLIFSTLKPFFSVVSFFSFCYSKKMRGAWPSRHPQCRWPWVSIWNAKNMILIELFVVFLNRILSLSFRSKWEW